MRIEFDFAGDQVRAVVSAAEPEALSLLRRGHAGLLRDLAEMGYGDADIEYAEGGDAFHDAPTPEDAPSARRFALVGSATDTGPSARPRLHDGALDITL